MKKNVFSLKTLSFSLAVCSRLDKPLLIMYGFHVVISAWLGFVISARLGLGLKISNEVAIEKIYGNQTHTTPIGQRNFQVQEIVIYLCFLIFSNFDREKFGFAPNSYTTRPKQTRSISGKILGLCKTSGFSNPYRTRTRPVLYPCSTALFARVFMVKKSLDVQGLNVICEGNIFWSSVGLHARLCQPTHGRPCLTCKNGEVCQENTHQHEQHLDLKDIGKFQVLSVNPGYLSKP